MTALYTLPISLDLGVDYVSPVFAWFQADGVTPRSLQGYSARLIFAVNRRDVRPQLRVTSVMGVLGYVVLGAPPNASVSNGLVSFTVTQAGLSQFSDRSGVYDLLLDSGDAVAVTTKLVSGTWSLQKSAAGG